MDTNRNTPAGSARSVYSDIDPAGAVVPSSRFSDLSSNAGLVLRVRGGQEQGPNMSHFHADITDETLIAQAGMQNYNITGSISPHGMPRQEYGLTSSSIPQASLQQANTEFSNAMQASTSIFERIIPNPFQQAQSPSPLIPISQPINPFSQGFIPQQPAMRTFSEPEVEDMKRFYIAQIESLQQDYQRYRDESEHDINMARDIIRNQAVVANDLSTEIQELRKNAHGSANLSEMNAVINSLRDRNNELEAALRQSDTEAVALRASLHKANLINKQLDSDRISILRELHYLKSQVAAGHQVPRAPQGANPGTQCAQARVSNDVSRNIPRTFSIGTDKSERWASPVGSATGKDNASSSTKVENSDIKRMHQSMFGGAIKISTPVEVPESSSKSFGADADKGRGMEEFMKDNSAKGAETAVEIIQNASRSDPRKNHRVLDLHFKDIPEAFDLDTWLTDTIQTKIPNAFPEAANDACEYYKRVLSTKTIDELDGENDFPYLDAKGITEFERKLERCSNEMLKARIAREKREASKSSRNRLSLSHYIFILIDHLKHRKTGENLFRLADLMNIKPRCKRTGDTKDMTLGDVNRFVDEFDKVRGDLKFDPDEETLYTIFVDQSGIHKVNELRYQWQLHEELPDDQKTFKDFYDRVVKVLDKFKMKKNQLSMLKKTHMGTGLANVAVPAQLQDVMSSDDDADAMSNRSQPATPARRRTPSSLRGRGARRSPGGRWGTPGGSRYSSRGRSRITPRGSRISPRGSRYSPKRTRSRSDSNRNRPRSTSRSPNGRSFCRDFQKGRCQAAAGKCRFSHYMAPGAPAPPTLSPAEKKKIQCVYEKSPKGCLKGNKCDWLHTGPAAPAEVAAPASLETAPSSPSKDVSDSPSKSANSPRGNIDGF